MMLKVTMTVKINTIIIIIDYHYHQAGTNSGKLARGLRGPTEFLRTKRSARVFSVGLRLSLFLPLGPQSSVLGPQSSFPGPQSPILNP